MIISPKPELAKVYTIIIPLMILKAPHLFVLPCSIVILLLVTGLARDAQAIWPFDDTNSPDMYFDGPALDIGRAIERDEIGRIQALAPSVNLNAVGKKEMTLLFFAAGEKRFQAVTALVKQGADPLKEGKSLGSVLGVALAASEPELLSALLDGGVSPNTKSKTGTPILFLASSNIEQMKLLLERGANIDEKDSLGRTVIREALSHNDFEMVEYLLSRGADLHVVDVNGLSFAYSLQAQHARAACNPDTAAYKKLDQLKASVERQGIKFPVVIPPSVKANLAKNPERADPCRRGKINEYTIK